MCPTGEPGGLQPRGPGVVQQKSAHEAGECGVHEGRLYASSVPRVKADCSDAKSWSSSGILYCYDILCQRLYGTA